MLRKLLYTEELEILSLGAIHDVLRRVVSTPQQLGPASPDDLALTRKEHSPAAHTSTSTYRRGFHGSLTDLLAF
jgi:hypothetical protein